MSDDVSSDPLPPSRTSVLNSIAAGGTVSSRRPAVTRNAPVAPRQPPAPAPAPAPAQDTPNV